MARGNMGMAAKGRMGAAGPRPYDRMQCPNGHKWSRSGTTHKPENCPRCGQKSKVIGTFKR
jgi:hypothetical protein